MCPKPVLEWSFTHMQADPSSAPKPVSQARADPGPLASTARRREITELLRAWKAGNDGAFAQLLPLVYDELRRRAKRHIGTESRNHLLQPTALVHELYCRFADSPPDVEWQDRGHFFAVAARAMRQILVDHARASSRRKRGGRRAALSLTDVGEVAVEHPQALVSLDEALSSLAALDPVKASLIELRFFAGLTIEEAGEAIGCSTATVTRHWRAARAWLYRELARSDADDDA
jgi:RNA polymerase sigma factor (TIGR02999 family)